MTKAKRTPSKRKKRVKRSARRKTIAQLKKNAWRVFSQYIRLRDSDEKGNCTCITCGRYDYWRKFHAGHFIQQKGYPATIFEEQNIAAQCPHCNLRLAGQQWKFGLALCEKHGEEAVDELWRKAEDKSFKFTTQYIQNKLSFAKSEVKRLKLEKNIFD